MITPHPAPLAAQKLYELVVAAAAPQRETLRVDFGDPGEFEEPDAIAIGLSVRTPEAITGVVARTLGYEMTPYEIACTAQSWSGDSGSPDESPALIRMVRVFEVVDIVRDVCLANRDLGLPKVVAGASVTREAFSQLAVERGELAFVEFTVRIEAGRLRR